MNMDTASAYSLRKRLLLLLLLAISATALVQGVIAYRSALADADQIFDYHMQQMAMSLRAGFAGNAIDASADDLELDDDGKRDFVVQIWTLGGLRVFESAARAALPQRAVIGFSDVQANGRTYRVYSLQSSSHVVQVAQDMTARSEMARSLAIRTVLPIAALAPLLMLIVWWSVSASLTPLARVRRQLAARQPDSLEEVSETGLPDEIRPLVRELNLLFGRVREAFDVHKNFVADAAHELRSPLAALKLQAQSIQRAPDDATRELALSRLTAGIDRATRLVEQLLVLARHQASAGMGASAQRVSLAEIARLAVADLAPSAQSRRIDVGLGSADENPVSGYPDALRILVRNLLDNAVKYSPEGATVDVGVAREDGHLVLSVEDSGPGIAQADRERVFDRFYRIAGTQASGSGLGLAIVRSIARLHGASLHLDQSQRLGGLRVQVRFPIAG
jgi:two-component system, OmpR family, sensor kinase